VRIGTDAIVGCGEHIFLLQDLVGYLRELGICTLNRIEDNLSSTI
jgi:hypothetical protein